MIAALSNRHQTILACVFAVLMAATRFQPVQAFEHLPEASWAVFFLAGIYVRSIGVFALLFIEGVAIDWAAISLGDVSAFCISPAYAAMLPGYAALWGAGRWYARQHRDALASLLPYTAAGFLGAMLCEIITSGSFYFFSGRTGMVSLGGFGETLLRYASHNLNGFGLYAVTAAVLHAIAAGWALGKQKSSQVS